MTEDHMGALLEVISDQLKGVAEGVVSLNTKVDSIDARLSKVESQTEQIPAIKSAIRDVGLELKRQDSQLSNHKERISDLESQAA